jgi:hypothetical protein
MNVDISKHTKKDMTVDTMRLLAEVVKDKAAIDKLTSELGDNVFGRTWRSIKKKAKVSKEVAEDISEAGGCVAEYYTKEYLNSGGSLNAKMLAQLGILHRDNVGKMGKCVSALNKICFLSAKMDLDTAFEEYYKTIVVMFFPPVALNKGMGVWASIDLKELYLSEKIDQKKKGIGADGELAIVRATKLLKSTLLGAMMSKKWAT